MKEMFRLDGRTAVVAGAGAGIGAAVARGCAAQGALVVCADIDAAAAEETAATIRGAGGTAEVLSLDITASAAVATAFHRVREAHGRVDVAVCTPGVNVRKPLLDYTDEEFERVIRLNLGGTLNVFRAAGRVMSEQQGGSIIAFSSIRSLVVEPGQGVYAATKAGIVQMVRTLAAELGPLGVRVNAIAPGVVDTPLTAPIKADPDWYQAYSDRNIFRRWASADEMAGPAVFLASDAASYVTGTVLFVDGGWTAIDGRFEPSL
ncbi:MAG: SDR family oxidoreductase [Gemmatimonadota bacterium]|nr:SDR family oxidoreductase [Gemmatimonadota bacterium]